MTTRYTLTDQSWTDLGAGPLFVELIGVATALLVIDTAAPGSIGADAQVLALDRLHSGTFGSSANHIYARAGTGSTTYIVTSPAAVTSSGGGGGAATIADGADVAEGAKADAAATNATGSWSVVALLKGLYAAMVAPTPAGEAHIGEVGGNVTKFQAQFGPASSTTFTTGQAMSAPIEVTGMGRVANGTGLITAASLELAAANTIQVDLVVFSAQPSGTYTAGSTFTIASGDRVKASKAIKLTDWTSLGAADSLGEPTPAPKFYRCDDATKTTSLWVVPIARGSITLATATDATLTMRGARN